MGQVGGLEAQPAPPVQETPPPPQEAPPPDTGDAEAASRAQAEQERGIGGNIDITGA